MQPNFIVQITTFERWLESHPLPPAAQLLWYKLFLLFNRCGWPEWVQIDNRRIMLMIGTYSEKTAIGVRSRLVEAGLLAYEKGRKGRPGRYKLLWFACKNDGGSDSVSDSASGSISAAQPPAIHKQKTKVKRNDAVIAPPASYDIEALERQLWEPI